MPIKSPKHTLLGAVIGLASMSFLAGFFLMFTIAKAVQNDLTYVFMFLLLLPLLIFAAALNGRRIFRTVSELHQ